MIGVRAGVWAAFGLLGFGLIAGASAQAQIPYQAQQSEPPIVNSLAEEPSESVAEVLRRKDGRVSTLVKVNEQGPYPFIVDTGANRSSISQELANTLRLPVLESRVVNGVTGAQLRAVVQADTVSAGSFAARALQLPVIEDVVLGGSRGLLAANELKGQRIVLDFANERYEVTKSRSGGGPPGTQKLKAKLRFGHLVETPCRIGGRRARCIIDTGAEYTLLNLAMLETLRPDRRTEVLLENISLYGATDSVITGSVLRLPPIEVGEVRFEGSTALATDAHIFDVWGLSKTPAVLLGMNVLRACDFLAIDFPQKALYVRAPLRGELTKINR